MVKAINPRTPKFTTHADGSDAVLFMHELVGEQDGPTIGISAAIHGNENDRGSGDRRSLSCAQGHAL